MEGVKITNWQNRHGIHVERDIRFMLPEVFFLDGDRDELRGRLLWYRWDADVDMCCGPYVVIRSPLLASRRLRLLWSPLFRLASV